MLEYCVLVQWYTKVRAVLTVGLLHRSLILLDTALYHASASVSLIFMVHSNLFWLYLCTLYAESLYCRPIDFLGRKINLSGISAAKRSRSGPNFVYVDMSRGLGNFGRDRPILGKMAAGTIPEEREFFLDGGIHAICRQLRNGRFSPNLATKRISVSR